MYWDWLTYLLVIVAVVAALIGLYALLVEGSSGGFIGLVVAALFVGWMFIHSWAHHRDQHDAQARTQLHLQGFQVIEALTTDHQATIALGACQRTMVMKRVNHVWHLYVNQPDGQTVIYPSSTAKQAGPACSPAVR